MLNFFQNRRIMPNLTIDIENRINKLPDPSNAVATLQPLFEAVSNAFFAIEDKAKFSPQNLTHHEGTIRVDIMNFEEAKNLEITIQDNGIGLDKERFQAFCTIDTPFRKKDGGKGVGRLFWLAAFQHIEIHSVFYEDEVYKERIFSFKLNNKDQIIGGYEPKKTHITTTGTTITFKGLKAKYCNAFPKQKDSFCTHLATHFISNFLNEGTTRLVVTIDNVFTKTYPQAITDLVVKKFPDKELKEIEDLLVEQDQDDDKKESIDKNFLKNNPFYIQGFLCQKKASLGLGGGHHLHLLANKRNVQTLRIDRLLGLKNITDEHKKNELVFHGCLFGELFDQYVTESRTAFNLEEKIIKTICRVGCNAVRTSFLKDQVEKFNDERKRNLRNFLQNYPTYGFDSEEKLLKHVHFAANTEEDFAAGLVKHQIRDDKNRQKKINEIIALVEKGDADTFKSLKDKVSQISNKLQHAELLGLAHHVVRRKCILELLEKLIQRTRSHETDKDDDFHLEETLHSLIVPMRMSGVNPKTLESKSHDLWIIDERLAFTRAFTSDVELGKILRNTDETKRPDILLWNQHHALASVDPRDKEKEVDVSEPLNKVMLVEFKRPRRESYLKSKDQIESQIIKYLTLLKNGKMETFNRRSVRIGKDCLFYCYVIADIVGGLKQQLSTWQQTRNGEGRIRHLEGDFRGSTIEVIQWQDLVNDAWTRNKAVLNAAGLKKMKHDEKQKNGF